MIQKQELRDTVTKSLSAVVVEVKQAWFEPIGAQLILHKGWLQASAAPRLPAPLSHSGRSSWQPMRDTSILQPARSTPAFAPSHDSSCTDPMWEARSRKPRRRRMGPHLLFCSSVCQLPCTAFSSIFFFLIEPEASGVQRTGSSLELDEEEKKKSQKKPPLAERCQQVAFSPRALPPPAVFSAAPTEIWPLCHFLGSRPPRRARSAAGEEGTAWQRPCSFPKSA